MSASATSGLAPRDAATSVPPGHRRAWPLILAALGVVYGDIGTSPLYTMRESLHALHGHGQPEVLGVLSLVFWALVLVVSLKYLTFVLRADNGGEGGIFALLALFDRRRSLGPRPITVGVFLALAGASLLFGEAIITPAISVLSASEGFRTFDPAFAPFVVPIAVAILVGLFLVQSKGSQAIGQVFGRIMLVWFAVLGGLGLWRIAGAPEVLLAIDPRHGIRLLTRAPAEVMLLLGGVVLAITGVEALYADMGHFGRAAIRRGWYGVVLPGLTLNYFGQGALVLGHPEAAADPFFSLAPPGLPRLFLVLLSIAATVIASQALISGTFSLVRQAIQLGFFPRLQVQHTNPREPGQIYMPFVNALLAIGAITAVLGFQSSRNLAAAYGLAVTGTMAVTTLSFYLVCRRAWHWSPWRAAPLAAGFLVIDLAFFGSNLGKLSQGGWLPFGIGVLLIAIMGTWKRGRAEITRLVYGPGDTEVELSAIARSEYIVRVPGSAVFMAALPRGTPLALLHHLKANRALQKTAVLLTILTADQPYVPEVSRLGLEDCGEGVWRCVARYGYMESPDVASLVERIRSVGVPIDPAQTTYYFNREMILSGGTSRLWGWQKALYAFLTRNARPAKDYYQIPPSQIIEIGLPVQL